MTAIICKTSSVLSAFINISQHSQGETLLEVFRDRIKQVRKYDEREHLDNKTYGVLAKIALLVKYSN